MSLMRLTLREDEMKTLEKGQDKIKKISEQLIKEALEPAQSQSKEIIDQAHAKASEIIADAQKQAEQLIAQAKVQNEQERHLFHSALAQAGKQGLEAFRETIMHRLFDDQLQESLSSPLEDPQTIAKFITAIIHGIEKEGISGDLLAVIPKSVSPQEVNRYLGEQMMKKLQGKGLQIGDFKGGAQVKVVDKNLTLDVTDSALKELMSTYLRKDFRKLLFG